MLPPVGPGEAAWRHRFIHYRNRISRNFFIIKEDVPLQDFRTVYFHCFSPTLELMHMNTEIQQKFHRKSVNIERKVIAARTHLTAFLGIALSAIRHFFSEVDCLSRNCSLFSSFYIEVFTLRKWVFLNNNNIQMWACSKTNCIVHEKLPQTYDLLQ